MTPDVCSRSRGAMRPRLALISRPSNRGRRESRVRAAPAVSCASCTKRCAHEHTGSAEASRLSLRDGFTAYFALSPVNGFVATVAGGIPPANLTPASRRQDHTTSPSASACARQSQLSRPPHPTRAFVTCATPLSSGETRRLKSVICPTATAEYFCSGVWTG